VGDGVGVGCGRGEADAGDVGSRSDGCSTVVTDVVVLNAAVVDDGRLVRTGVDSNENGAPSDQGPSDAVAQIDVSHAGGPEVGRSVRKGRGPCSKEGHGCFIE